MTNEVEEWGDGGLRWEHPMVCGCTVRISTHPKHEGRMIPWRVCHEHNRSPWTDGLEYYLKVGSISPGSLPGEWKQ